MRVSQRHRESKTGHQLTLRRRIVPQEQFQSERQAERRLKLETEHLLLGNQRSVLMFVIERLREDCPEVCLLILVSLDIIEPKESGYWTFPMPLCISSVSR